ncbi:MAG TPA: SDR family oxidoreductase [Candidatus Aquilonibacter sp.]|jgi:NAD(P)-dependent dehydrogenase (short-subunit alcohol dehydrogenase family)|nr:SDR family oxidoreductase [Candidatus Aquilonibacter sp.]
MTTSLFNLEGKTAVVIGGNSGIGQALALGLAEAGADVIASSRRKEAVEETAKQIEALGRKTLRLTADVALRTSLEKLRDAVISAFGKVDVLVNCAGITSKGPTLNFAEERWQEILDTNLTGTLRGCQVFGEHMLERKAGRIINIASLTTHLGLFEVAAYGASKAGVGSLTKMLAVEWSCHGVLVNAILPGVFRTALNTNLLDNTPRGREFLTRTPMGRFGDVRELVGAAVFLASEASSFVTGTLVVVDGGFLASGVNQ